jgi:hypothetical protein
MKKSILMTFAIISLFACKKNDTSNSFPQNDVLHKVVVVGEKYKQQTSGKNKLDTRKAILMGIADGVGGYLGAGTGNAYGILYSAWFASLGIGSLLSPTIPHPETTTNTGSDQFDMGQTGDVHNKLLYQIHSNRIVSLFNEDNTIRTEVMTMMEDAKNVIPGTTPIDITTIKTMQPSFLNAYLDGQMMAAEDGNVIAQTIKNSPTSAEAQNVILEIVSTLSATDLTIDNKFSFYLNEVEETIKSDKSLSESDKTAIEAFLAITNSSIYYWNVNLN